MQRLERGSGLGRKTLHKIPYYPEPKEIYKSLLKSEGWPYKTDKETYLIRDRSLASVTYLVGLRISETLRLTKGQFIEHENYIEIRTIELSKSQLKGKQRRDKYREGRLPLEGERLPLTKLVLLHLETLNEAGRLFRFKPARAWQIITCLFPDATCHWLRAWCEDYLYTKWGNDLLAVADYVKVDPRTLQEYIRRRYQKYAAV